MATTNKEKEVVRFNVNLPKETYNALVQLKDITQKSSLAETFRDALRLYVVLQEGREAGKDLFLISDDEREKIVMP